MKAFWRQYPALYYGLAVYFGFLFILETAWALLPFSFLLLHKKNVFKACILFLLPAGIIYQFYTFPPKKSSVEGLFYIESYQKTERFGVGYTYKGILKTNEGKISCRCFSKTEYSPNIIYRIKGAVSPLYGKAYSLRAQGEWQIVKSRLSLVAWRSRAHEYVKNYIERNVCKPRATCFLQGMVTGQLQDKMLAQEFNQLGLSHLMAISGLHFSLIALVFHLFLRLFLPHKLEALSLMAILTAYLLFIGPNPSILRTWITVVVFLSGQLLEMRSSAINSLGVALLLSLLYNPLSATSLGFQLSFLATAGILFFYEPCNRLLQLWFPKCSLKETAVKHTFFQHAYIMTVFFREALALTLAVHCAIFILLLKTFHLLSLNSLVYNLFFPFLASIALVFFIVSIPLGHWAHVLNGYYCEWILRMPESPPIVFKAVYVETVPVWLCTLLLTALLIAAIGIKIKEGADRLGVIDDPLFNHL